MKMTTPIPPGLAAPDVLETSVGTFRLSDGVPDDATVRKVYDNLDLMRGVQAYLGGIQIASMDAMRQGLLAFGPANTTVAVFEGLMDSNALFLTANTSNIYAMTWMDLSDGPVVMESAPNVLGLVNDHWFKYVADFGNAGPDEGKGGRYLFTPPGYEGEVPEGYFHYPSNTFGHWVLFRGFQLDGDPQPAVDEIKATHRMYLLKDAEAPPEMSFVNVTGEIFNTIGRTDYALFEDLNNVVQANPADGESPELLGTFASIGIVKGQPFRPDFRMKAILEDAAKIGVATVRTLAAKPRSADFYYYPGESYWSVPFVGGSHEFVVDGHKYLDARAFFHFYATGITPAMVSAAVGKGSQYAALYLDENGVPLDGSRTYAITLPPDIPAGTFWSIVIYDNQTRSMLQTDARFPSVSSARGEVPKNTDGSTTVYVGPQAPERKEANWIQTIPGKGWNAILRLYSPGQPWFDKTWRPGDAIPID